MVTGIMIVQDLELKYNVKQTIQVIYHLIQIFIEEVVVQHLGILVYRLKTQDK
jgi:hypothetical protein